MEREEEACRSEGSKDVAPIILTDHHTLSNHDLTITKQGLMTTSSESNESQGIICR